MGTDGSGRQVAEEGGLDEAGLSVAGTDLAPHGLEVSSSLLVLGAVDVSNALAVVEQGRLGVVAALDLEDGKLFGLGALSTLVVQKDCSLVESMTFIVTKTLFAYLMG